MKLTKVLALLFLSAPFVSSQASESNSVETVSAASEATSAATVSEATSAASTAS